MRRPWTLSCLGAMGFIAGTQLATAPAQAINIILNYDNGQSVNPAQDPNATGLQDLFDYAEAYYEDVFQDSHANTTITLNFWYEDLDWRSTTTWGLHTLVDENNNSGEPWREVEANLRFDNDRTWFIDPTPEDDSEFNMTQTLWRDLSSAQQSDFYNNFTATNIPDTFEVGWRGTAVPGGAADGVGDLLTTVMHEVGHALGLSASATATANETGVDLDYDFNPDHVFGQSLAAEAVSGSEGHLDVDFAMMCGGCAATSLRRMPSHTDLFAMAASHNYDNIDVPRREFYGGSNWNTSGNWSGDAVPHFNDDVFVRDPGAVVTANLSANGSAANLTVAEGGNVDTEGFKLDVGGLVLVTDVDTDLFIRSGGELEASTLRIENDGEVRPSAGGLIDVNTLDINATGELIGAGTVDVATTLSNDGLIQSTGDSLLTFTTTGGSVWNLDGSGGNGRVDAITGSINFSNGNQTDAFDGEMNVGAGQYINFATGWELGTGGVLTLGGGVALADRAEVQGDTVVRGDIVVDKEAELDGQTTFYSTANISIPDADDRLALGVSASDTVTYNGGTFTGNGTLAQDGDATVTAGSTVTIDVGSFDWDGGPISDTTILAGATMDIIGGGIADAHDGVITINSGTLNVATGTEITIGGGLPLFLPAPWEMAGSLVFLDNGQNPVLSGSKVNITGAVSVPITGTGVITAPVEFHPSSNTEVTSASDKLQLDGSTVYNGGTYTGFGEIEQNGNATVSSTTTIGVGRFDMDGSGGGTTITLNADLIINSTYIEDGTGNVFNGTISITDDAYELTVNTASPWTMAGTLNITTDTFLTQPAIDGVDFTMSGTTNITGGTRFDARVDITGDINFLDASSRLAILGGNLSDPNTIAGGMVNGPAGSSLRAISSDALVGYGDINVRLDFLSGSELLADDGTLNVQNNFISMGVIGTNDTDGVLNVNGAWNTSTADELQLNGGSVTGGAITNGGQTFGFGSIVATGFDNTGDVTSNGGVLIIDTGSLDLDGATENGSLTLDSDMTVNNTTIDVGNNVFNGTIDVNSAFATLTVNTTDPWEMAGTLTVTHGVNSANTSIAGSHMIMSGVANLNAWTGWAARTTVSGTVNVNLAGDVLSLSGGNAVDTNLIDGGLITGPGRLSLGSSKRLVGNGTISTAEISMSLGSRILADDGILIIDSTLNPAGFARIGTNDTDGNLRVSNPWNTSLYQALELNGGQVSGAAITNGGLTTGFGTVATTGAFSNDNILTADGGDLNLNPVGALDLDGAANTGTINATTGSVVVVKNVGLVGFAGTLNIGGGQTYKMASGGLINNGVVNMTGGFYTSTAQFSQAATLNVNTAPSFISAVSRFENGSNSSINDDLTLQADSFVLSGANINGSGSLIVGAGTTMDVEDGTALGVELVNHGDLVFGASPGTLTADDFTQTASGAIEFELGGLAQGVSYDWLKVGDNAALNGTLDIALFGGFVPSLGDAFQIITAGTGVFGTFSAINGAALGGGLVLDVIYNANDVTLEVVNATLEGDLNGDGFVGIADLNIVLGNWNLTVPPGDPLADPTGDNFVGIADLNVVLGNWNAGTPPTTNAAIPEPATAALLSVGLMTLVRRKH